MIDIASQGRQFQFPINWFHCWIASSKINKKQFLIWINVFNEFSLSLHFLLQVFFFFGGGLPFILASCYEIDMFNKIA